VGHKERFPCVNNSACQGVYIHDSAVNRECGLGACVERCRVESGLVEPAPRATVHRGVLVLDGRVVQLQVLAFVAEKSACLKILLLEQILEVSSRGVGGVFDVILNMIRCHKEIEDIAYVQIGFHAPPNSGSFLGLFPTGCAIPSASLSCSKEEPCRHGPCSSFRSSEEPHAGFTTVVLGSLTLASFGVLPVGCLRALVVARVGVVGPKLASRLRAVSSGAFTRRLDTQRLARQNT
jgi:hypothetical protein